MHSHTTAALVIVVAGALASLAPSKGGGSPASAPRVEAGALSAMPVKEVAVFKDGHAFVLHESEVPTDLSGDVVLDMLPTPVIGTFWPYSADAKAKLKAVVSGRRKVRTDRTALSIRDLIEANPGAEVRITEQGGASYGAAIIGVPKNTPKSEESPPGAAGSAGQARSATPAPASPAANVVLLKLNEGTKVLPLERIQDVTFLAEPSGELPIEEERKLMTLQLDWGGAAPNKSAKVGMVYLQKGIRWIPNYRIDIDGQGQARVKLQATLINEMVDLDGATAHLVIGVPSFYFKDTIDPMALQESAAQLSQYFQTGQRMGYAFSNAIATQVMRQTEYAAPPPAETNQPELTDAAKHEDLFIFTVSGVTLGKGERMVVPIAEYTLPYVDVFTLDVPFTPPPEVRGNLNSEQAFELARMMSSPKVMHRIRLENKSAVPLTTAPALLLRDGKLIAQSMMTYTPVGGRSDLDLTTAVDVSVVKSEVETKRTPNAEKWAGDAYARIDLTGKIQLRNHRDKPIQIEVKRHVLGAVARADHDGAIEKTSALEDAGGVALGDYPPWWRWYSWPYWWHGMNGFGRVTWKVALESGQSIDLNYDWYYYWR